MTETFELVRRAQAGDDPALNALIERYYERVRRAVRALIGPQLRKKLETVDILQPAFAKAFQDFDRFEMRDEGSLLHWLLRYAQNQVNDQVRHWNSVKRDPRKERPLESPVTDSATVHRADLRSATATAPPDAVARDEENRALEAALDELEPDHRKLIVLFDFLGMSWADVAREAGRPSADAARIMHGTAQARLAIALRRRGLRP